MRTFSNCLFLTCGFLAVAMLAASGQGFYFTTLAGAAGQPGGATDGTNSVARFNKPGGVAVDPAGTVYVADTYNHLIRKVTPSGQNWVVTTIAGVAGNSGTNDGAGGSAKFWYPRGLAVDSQTNLYVADSYNHTIRKLARSGTNWVVSTIAGVPKVSGNANGAGSSATFNYPSGLAVDEAGNLFVADTYNQLIRMVAPNGGGYTVSAPAGLAGIPGIFDGLNASARFNYPYGIAVDGAGNLFVADSNNSTIRRVTPEGSDWRVTTIAGQALEYPGAADGTNTAALFNYPYGIAAGNAGNLVVADTQNDTLRQLVPSDTNWVTGTLGGTPMTTGSANGGGEQALFYQPQALAVDGAGLIYIADTFNNTLRLGQPAVFLNSVRVGTQLALSWPLGASNYVLETSASLGLGAAWSGISSGIVISGPNYTYSTGIGAGRAFYRLHKQ